MDSFDELLQKEMRSCRPEEVVDWARPERRDRASMAFGVGWSPTWRFPLRSRRRYVVAAVAEQLLAVTEEAMLLSSACCVMLVPEEMTVCYLALRVEEGKEEARRAEREERQAELKPPQQQIRRHEHRADDMYAVNGGGGGDAIACGGARRRSITEKSGSEKKKGRSDAITLRRRCHQTWPYARYPRQSLPLQRETPSRPTRANEAESQLVFHFRTQCDLPSRSVHSPFLPAPTPPCRPPDAS